MTDQVIVFDRQEEWERLSTDMHEEMKINVLVTSSDASQIPTVARFEDVKHSLSYSQCDGKSPESVVLDILLGAVPVADNEQPPLDDAALSDAIRKAVKLIQEHAERSDCHITGHYLHESNEIDGALIRVYRNQDFHCKGHPEMLLGKPLGMFHCDKCGEMQMAGMFHLPKEEAENV